MGQPELAEHRRRFAISTRSVLYFLAFFWIFGFTVAELGLVGHQLHRYGNSYENYANNQYKHGLGILLFSVVASLLVTLSHPWLSVWIISICSFIMAVFFGTGAGIIQQDAPFTGHGCKRKPLEDYPVAWRPYAVECDNIIAIQGVAWSLWVLYIFLWVGTLVQKLSVSVRATPENFYGSKV
ncbi:hypothetical protein AGABI1DRAFT_83525 [Agaricus bisporus var. burnettii JB137-S8]|uniref:MARVEL domain-containing protein n=1 Tax=Agaricus bisporus var. burnettii (strain JB137-S8 / ATCC MYA-4627 / FGSC 10392) TaxID=597362 RepID=K5XFQ7_AGABU|nr:uncharacterized protein AGABI1DRAFT_83525 [Agaricus bisporus var. burnettii JB137-S8]EKM82243.1 hypothetical protein AGABI1DRAFT_83525 [Agaricus bisporus var. burnettii JB137-S8]